MNKTKPVLASKPHLYISFILALAESFCKESREGNVEVEIDVDEDIRDSIRF